MVSIERSQVQWGTTPIPYAIRRSSRRGTVSIAVEAGGSVVLTAPAGVPVGRLDLVVRKKARWIVERMKARRRSEPPPAPHEFVSGETFWYLGRQYRLRIEGGQEGDRVALRGRWLQVAMGHPQKPQDRAQRIRAALASWYREHAADRLPERVAAWAQQVEVAEPELVVREQAKRWASCDKAGVLRVNWRIIQAPMWLVDYVIAHELVHLRVRDHGSVFWALLGKVMPDYEERREGLAQIGPRLVW